MAGFMTLVGVLLIVLGVIFNLYLILVGLIFIFLGWVARRIPAPQQHQEQPSTPMDPRFKAAAILFIIGGLLLYFLVQGFASILSSFS